MADPRPAEELPDEVWSALFHATPVALIVLRADDLTMVAANDPYLAAVGRRRDEILGRHVFDVFPNSPTNAGGDQAHDLADLFARAASGTDPVVVEGMRYDIEVDGDFQVRWWNVTETPVLGADGRVTHLLHYTEDVTALRRAEEALGAAEAAEARAAGRVQAMTDAALQLTAAQSVDDLERIVIGSVIRSLDASGGALLTRGEEGGWRLRATATLDEELQRRYQELPADSPFPVVVAARTAQRILLGSRTEGLTGHPSLAEVYERTDRVAFACLPLVSQGRRLGAIQVSWNAERDFPEAELALMEGTAAQCATALDRILQTERQRRTAEQIRHLAETLQAAMLTEPSSTLELDLAVRYRPANDVARVGGDWYDAFAQPTGETVVVIGDVSGHDDVAAAKMGQARGLLRALAYDSPDSPATLLHRFEHTARGLEVDTITTAVLARVAASPEPGGSRRMTWANAGNPPPVLVHPDGTTELLQPASADLLLGIDPDFRRHDHETLLPPGATVVLYTDGLIERRDASIDAGLADLRAALAVLALAPVGDVCDEVLAKLDPHTGEDDIAMVAFRV